MRPAAESFGACCDGPGYWAGISSGCCDAFCAPAVAPNPSNIVPAKKTVVRLARELFMDIPQQYLNASTFLLAQQECRANAKPGDFSNINKCCFCHKLRTSC